MSRYGYADMPEGYSDVSMERVVAICCDCGQDVTVDGEGCWLEYGILMTHCGCTEIDDTPPHPSHIQWLQSIGYDHPMGN